MKAQVISTEFYLILLVVCVGFVVLLLFSGMVQRVTEPTAEDTCSDAKVGCCDLQAFIVFAIGQNSWLLGITQLVEAS